jgi:hypothetical protein
MLWNYRLVTIADRVGLYEVFYEQDGQILACSQDPITLEADSSEELEIYLQGLQEALKLPVLQLEDLPPIPEHSPFVDRGTPLETLWEELGLEKEELLIAASKVSTFTERAIVEYAIPED